jgi:tRNA-dihydrouridine synthase B
MQIGPYRLANNLLLAPMAGVSDMPFRKICAEFDAGLTVSEMVISKTHLQNHPKTIKKTDYIGIGIHAVQLLGTDPVQLALAAQLNQKRGAQIIDINMGCPAKKVCAVASGSALLRDEALVEKILTTVVNAVDIPVTLKIRTGWDKLNRNAATIARIAENSGVKALTIHGRSRACKFEGQAEYDTIKSVKQIAGIPIIANGDITCALKAEQVLKHTSADGIMIGRSALGKPWIFKEINLKLQDLPYTPPSLLEINGIINRHLDLLYSYYGNSIGVKIARKHIGWYFEQLGGLPDIQKSLINQAIKAEEQLALVNHAFDFISSKAE